jgi:uncharacterized delta-60 repeat protein
MPDNGLVLATGSLDRSVVVAYDSRGQRRRRFATEGTAIHSLARGSAAAGVLRRRDGRVLVGQTLKIGTQAVLGLARFTTAGVLDPRFDRDGWASVRLPAGTNGSASAIAATARGRTLVAGRAVAGGAASFALARFTRSGVDRAFGREGVVITRVGEPSTLAEVRAIAVRKDGRVLLAGAALVGGRQIPVVLQLRASGQRDRAFGRAGVARVDLGAAAGVATALRLLPDGRVLVATALGPPSSAGFAVARLDRSGALDRTFGSRGATAVVFAGVPAGASALVAAPDGGVIAVGNGGGTVSPGPVTLVAARLDRRGRIDRRFGRGGRRILPLGEGDGQVDDAVLLPDGRVVVSATGGRFVFLVRLLADRPRVRLHAAMRDGRPVAAVFIDGRGGGVRWFVEYGRTRRYGKRTRTSTRVGSRRVALPITRPGLYHLRLVARNGSGVTRSNDWTLRIPGRR